ncbi:DUF4381 domain-containing protein [Methylobacterium brachythecii]|uniref:Antitoxin (DNA-binding transcriptional repressor) of toxin-antitoxin stability system n=1 Tax=Methylobacterium brachythecii TaxID=1176177 RepID=A0A7W6AHR0_9HYPH|nr:DUF4381 domain-containing protein [Methylobacterium brachythecii]MBB3902576.1 antitoxin (DNA-binding transcriptional repressor) of toxin-antitoxin stability system [Methylobacterium brachythecii]GLS42421.1 hypothetical protein GCM10007884_04060 [Methylobacterium brachythecii]
MNPDLSALRGLHLPSTGGNVVQGELVAAIALGFAAALIVGLARVMWLRAQTTIRRAALNELRRVRSLDPDSKLTAQARLLRRVVRTLAGDEAATTRGTAWAGTLDRTFATDFFSRGAGQILVEGLYRRPGATDPAAIEAELARLFSRIKG